MAGLFGISVASDYQGDFANDFFSGTFYQQHLGDDFSGAVTVNNRDFNVFPPEQGLFRQNFEKRKKDFKGNIGIGYCGSAPEPLFMDSRIDAFSICFSGNITNQESLKKDLMGLGQVFCGSSGDIEIIGCLIVQADNIIAGIENMAQKVEGAFSLLLLTEDAIYAVRSSDGHWPLVLGVKEGALAVASESGGFPNLGFKLYRDVRPGEIICLKEGKISSLKTLPKEKKQLCSFLWVYTAFPNATFNGIPVSQVREKLGAALARRDIERGFIPDIVSFVPYSGGCHGTGYHNEFCIQRNLGKIKRIPLSKEVIFKYPYSGRSNISQSEAKSNFEAAIKMLPSGENYEGQTVVICNDSVIKGDQASEILVPKLEAMGFKEVHFRISFPEFLHNCFFGKVAKPEELLAVRIPSKRERINFLNSNSPRKIVKSLEHNEIEDLAEAIGLPLKDLCLDCVV